MAKKPTPFEDSDDTPIQATPRNVTKAHKPKALVLPPDDDSIVAKEKVRAFQATAARAKDIEQKAEKVEEGITLLPSDLAKLHAMFAEINFDRSRDGANFQVTLKGSRGQTGGKTNKFGTFAALVEHLRTRA